MHKNLSIKSQPSHPFNPSLWINEFDDLLTYKFKVIDSHIDPRPSGRQSTESGVQGPLVYLMEKGVVLLSAGII